MDDELLPFAKVGDHLSNLLRETELCDVLALVESIPCLVDEIRHSRPQSDRAVLC